MFTFITIYVLGIFLSMSILTVVNWSSFRDDIAGTSDILKYIGLSLVWPLLIWFIITGIIIMIFETIVDLIKRHKLRKLSKKVNSINELLDEEINKS